MDLVLFVTDDDSAQSICQVGMWFNFVELGGLNQRGNDCPVFGASVMTGKAMP